MTASLALRTRPRTPPAARAHRRPVRGEWGMAGLLIAPLLALLVIFQFYPIVLAGYQSLHSFNPFTGQLGSYTGLHNYSVIFADPAFRAALRNTVLYIVLNLVLEIPIALWLATLINSRLPGRAALRITVLATLAASETVVVLVWNQLYDPSDGLFNALLSAVGIGDQPFLTSGAQALPSIVVMSVWKNLGLSVLIFLAGLQNVPTELEDAAALDGAGRFSSFVHITLPLLRRYLLVATFISTITSTRIFTPIILMTQGGPNNNTTNLSYYAYQQAFHFSSFGLAAAATVCMLALVALVTVLQGVLLRERS